jgi:hypothetical protein
MPGQDLHQFLRRHGGRHAINLSVYYSFSAAGRSFSQTLGILPQDHQQKANLPCAGQQVINS